MGLAGLQGKVQQLKEKAYNSVLDGAALLLLWRQRQCSPAAAAGTPGRCAAAAGCW
jgi:hypothetical protein